MMVWLSMLVNGTGGCRDKNTVMLNDKRVKRIKYTMLIITIIIKIIIIFHSLERDKIGC
jgi:hypothetical protein